MPRAAKPDFSDVFAVPVGSGVSLGAAIGEHGLRWRRWRCAVTWRPTGERPEAPARVAGTHRPSGVTAAINPGRSRSPLSAVSGWKLGLLITDFARFVNSEIALLCGRQGAATHGDLLVGSAGTHEKIARDSKEGSLAARCIFMPSARPSNRSIPPRAIAWWGLGPLHELIVRSHEGGVVGHALGAKRVALGPLSRGRDGLGRGARHGGVGVPAPDSQRSISMRIPGGHDPPTRARGSVRSHFEGHIPAATASGAALLVSELVTNSVVHANVGPQRALTVDVTTSMIGFESPSWIQAHA